jgi:hypothetical protein
MFGGIGMLRYFLLLSLFLPLFGSCQTSADANPKGNVFVLKAALSGGATYTCVFDTTRTSPQRCTDIGRMNHRLGGIQFQLLAHSGDRIQFGFRSNVPQSPSNGPGRMSVAEVESQPQTQYWFEPGQPLKIDVQFAGILDITGEWTDHGPAR